MKNFRQEAKKKLRRMRYRTRRNLREAKMYFLDIVSDYSIDKIKKFEFRGQVSLLIVIALVSLIIFSTEGKNSFIENNDNESKNLVRYAKSNISEEDEKIHESVIDYQQDIQSVDIKETKKKSVEYKFPLTKKEWKIFYRIVEAEVTGDKYPGCTEAELRLAKRHVADVIINRILDERFDNDIKSVVFAENQFMPTWDGRYWEVEITDMTKEVVREAMLATSKDTTEGAVFFCRGNMPDRQHLFKDAVGHNFFK